MEKTSKLENLLGSIGLSTMLVGMGGMAYQAFDAILNNHQLNSGQFYCETILSLSGAVIFSKAYNLYSKRKKLE